MIGPRDAFPPAAGRPARLTASLVLLPLELVFWIGFALPFGPPLGLTRVSAVALAQRSGAPARTAIGHRPG